MSQEYIEKSVKFRMGKWYRLPFILNEFSWKDAINKNYIYRSSGRWTEFVEQFQNLKYYQNPGLILDGMDHFEYNKFLKFKENAMEIPVGTHNRSASSKDSILFPLNCSIRDIFNLHAHKDRKYNFSEKKDEIVWRGKFTGRNRNARSIYNSKDIENKINEFLRFRFVKKWHKKYNIKFTYNYCWNTKDFWQDTYRQNPDAKSLRNKKYIENYFKENSDMLADTIPFFEWKANKPEKVIDEYKYILSLDGHDWASNIPSILMTNSVMISPAPKWHNIFNLDLTPWEHYVPVLDDASDLDKKLSWCKDHQEECEKIIQRANQYIYQFNLDSEAEIAKNIIERLYKNSKKI